MTARSALFTLVLATGVAGGIAFAQPVAASTTSSVVALSAGDDHTCSLHADGTVQCWGSNDFDQLGNPDVESSSTPVPVTFPGPTHVVAIAAGSFHTCAVDRDHRVFCWGDNGWGSLGIGSSLAQRTPVQVALAPTDAVASDVAAGGFTSCVLLSNGGAQCWGRNQYGEVGDTTRTLRNIPTPVVGVGDAVDIDAGDNHVCVLRSVGTMFCWGRNIDGRTGDATFANVAEVSAGGAHTCARTSLGALRCWGSNSVGQLTPNNLDTGIIRVSTGRKHTCVVADTGTVACWGDDSEGQLGESPVTFNGQVAVEVATGARHTCARLDDSSVWCWGHSLFGQAGDQTLTTPSMPVRLISAIAPVPTPPAPVTPAPVVPEPVAPEPVTPEPVLPEPVVPAPVTTLPTAPRPISSEPTPVAPEPVPAVLQPVTSTPASTVPVAPVPVIAEPVEKQATVVEAPSAPPAIVEAPLAPQAPVVSRSIPKPGVIELRLGSQAGLVRLGRAAGLRLPASLIASSLSRVRSVSANPLTRLRVEMSVSHPRNCRNVLTPTLGAAVRATRVGECRVTLRIERSGKSNLVRTVFIRTAAYAAPVNNLARNTR
jgi:alpha-tubulin suppressor-like RCC1 family protein